MIVGTHELTFKFGLFRFVALSKANASRVAFCAEPMSTLYPSALREVITPMTLSCGAGMYY